MQPIHWRKSTYSGDGSNCVEIATTPTAIHVRDSRARKDAPSLSQPPPGLASSITRHAVSPTSRRRTPSDTADHKVLALQPS
ncbi:DUF397 domain-containing protein [Streptomyces pseudovenezuelae]|uniref:DUF397 domain-containing protein n=1 Tax=Streptomyces pseudovenezuelae TaxID=67350 RepID=A0ABZ1WXE4_9ACTN|nr:DUF397 domain-containing protein [Streptomyces pseudovenezuelae]